MIYVFHDEDGNEVDLEYAAGTAPKIGSSVVVKGRLLKRMPVIPEAKVAPNIRFVSHALPRATKTEAGWSSPYSKDVEPETGKPRFNSMRDVRNAEAWSKANESGKHVVYD